jgi:succinate dehydrogenase / fumarate reductase, cytochrome b subunit
MSSFAKPFSLSTGRRFVMALTGLFLCAFLVEHLYGNLLLFKNDQGAAFVDYSHSMTHSILIRIVEVVLFAAIIIHIVQAINLTVRNNKARPVKYAVSKASENSSWFSRNMGLTGSLIFFFLVVHLNTFFVSYRITGLAEGENIALKVKEAFSSGWYSALYVIAVVFLGFHLNHGFQSAFQSLGLNDKKYAPVLKAIGTGFAALITIGFAAFPILFYFGLAGRTF